MGILSSCMAWAMVTAGVESVNAISISMMTLDLTVIMAASLAPSLVTERPNSVNHVSPWKVNGKKHHKKRTSILTGISRLMISFSGMPAAVTAMSEIKKAAESTAKV